jgi:AbrB family looped-hinge helix DNA binding protein
MTMGRFSTKGQIVIPKELRDAYAFAPGSEVEFVREKDGLKMRPLKQPGIRPTTLAEVSGMLAGYHAEPALTDDEIREKLAEGLRVKWRKDMGGET